MIWEGARHKKYLIASVLDGLEEVPNLEAGKKDKTGKIATPDSEKTSWPWPI